jgi:hypothetical protein
MGSLLTFRPSGSRSPDARLPSSAKTSRGVIHVERCGTTQNIGRAARHRFLTASNGEVRGPEMLKPYVIATVAALRWKGSAAPKLIALLRQESSSQWPHCNNNGFTMGSATTAGQPITVPNSTETGRDAASRGRGCSPCSFPLSLTRSLGSVFSSWIEPGG